MGVEQQIQTYYSGFNAMGKPVPEKRQVQAFSFVLNTVNNRYFDCTRFVLDVAEFLEADKPKEAMNLAMAHLDVSGAYRLLALLLTDEQGGAE